MNPYQSLPPRSFWRTAVADPDMLDIEQVWTPTFTLGQDDPVITAGSCFARQIGRALLERGMNWFDAEPPPPGLTEEERQARHYGVFSFRTGNIYTTATLRQWLSWAYGEATPPEEPWSQDGRWFDPYRPAIEPDGFADAGEMLAAREVTLAAVRDAVEEASCLVFTLGLTEAWLDARNGTVYPACPGTVRGAFDAERHVLRNFTFGEVHRDLSAAVELARAANPALRVLLTVSPVPLTATATDAHALAANTYTKSVLRAVAGQLAEEHEHVDYFPSYELVATAPFKGVFYEPNQRTVTPDGIAFVMRHFVRAFAERPAGGPAGRPRAADGRDATSTEAKDICEDAILDYYNAG